MQVAVLPMPWPQDASAQATCVPRIRDMLAQRITGRRVMGFLLIKQEDGQGLTIPAHKLAKKEHHAQSRITYRIPRVRDEENKTYRYGSVV